MSQGLCFPACMSLLCTVLLAVQECEMFMTSKPLFQSGLCDPSQSAALIHHPKKGCLYICVK